MVFLDVFCVYFGFTFQQEFLIAFFDDGLALIVGLLLFHWIGK
jgi:hypothetical protein